MPALRLWAAPRPRVAPPTGRRSPPRVATLVRRRGQAGGLAGRAPTRDDGPPPRHAVSPFPRGVRPGWRAPAGGPPKGPAGPPRGGARGSTYNPRAGGDTT